MVKRFSRLRAPPLTVRALHMTVRALHMRGARARPKIPTTPFDI